MDILIAVKESMIMAKMLAFTVVAAVTVVVILALRLGQLESPARADQIGDVTWTMTVDPPEPHVGKEFRVTITPCCFSGSPLFFQDLTITQDDPPVIAEVSKLDGYGSIVTLNPLREGTVQLQLRGAWEKWACYRPPPGTTTPGETPTPYPTMCASNFFYIQSPVFSVTVLAAPTPTPTATPNAVWNFAVTPHEAQVGDIVTVGGRVSAPCCQLSAELRIEQPDPPVLAIQTDDHQGSARLLATRPGTASLSMFFTYEQWVCLGTPEPGPPCESRLYYILSQTETVTVSAALGDPDCDGAVTSMDAELVLQLGAGLIREMPCQQAGDVNASSSVDAVDALLILQLVAGLIRQFA